VVLTENNIEFTPVQAGEIFTGVICVVEEFLFNDFNPGKQRLNPQHFIICPLCLMPAVENVGIIYSDYF
jgi:hypothetical protein